MKSESHVGLGVRWDFRQGKGLDNTKRLYSSKVLILLSNIYLSVCSQSAAQAPSRCPPSWRRELNPEKTSISLQVQPFNFVECNRLLTLCDHLQVLHREGAAFLFKWNNRVQILQTKSHDQVPLMLLKMSVAKANEQHKIHPSYVPDMGCCSRRLDYTQISRKSSTLISFLLRRKHVQRASVRDTALTSTSGHLFLTGCASECLSDA